MIQGERRTRQTHGENYRRRYVEGVGYLQPQTSKDIVARRKKRRKADLGYRLKETLRGRIWSALAGQAKSARTQELLGCPVIWLQVHLESQFRPGMSWENYGPVWHVDHIRPCASFDLSDPEQQKICFHWTNLQPLFAKENLSKGAKYGI